MGILSSLFGNSQKKDLQAAKAQADAQLAQGYGNANADYTKAINSYNPYVQAGQQANDTYAKMLGLQGAEAQRGAEGLILNDPAFTGQVNAENNNALRYLNARGLGGSGAFASAAARNLAGNYLNYRNAYQQAGQQGLQATGEQGNALAGRGQLAYGYGATRAGNEINYGNAMAQSRGIGINNLLGIAGTIGNFFRPSPTKVA